MVYLAAQSDAKKAFVSTRKIAGDLAISFHFLTKILQLLTQDRLLLSYRGPNGGVSLARSAQEISLLEIVESIDGPDLFTACVLGLSECGTQNPCPLHDRWAERREDLKTFFSQITLAKLAQDLAVQNSS